MNSVSHEYASTITLSSSLAQLEAWSYSSVDELAQLRDGEITSILDQYDSSSAVRCRRRPSRMVGSIRSAVIHALSRVRYFERSVREDVTNDENGAVRCGDSIDIAYQY